MKKLLVFHPALAPYRIDFFNKLSGSFDATVYFSLSNLIDQKFDQSKLRAELNFPFNLLASGFDVKNKAIRFGIHKILKKHNPDIVICSEYSQITLFVIFIKIFFGKKYKIYTISDDSIDLSIKRKGLRKLIRNISSNFLEGVIFPSENVCKWYNHNVNRSTKTLVLPIVHNNVEFRKKLESSLCNAEKQIKKHNLTNKKVIIYVGRLVKIKNIDFLIKAFADTKQKKENTVLFIIGDGQEKENLELLVKKLQLVKNCLFIGHLEGSDLYAWYNIAQCLVLPSYQEPYGAVVNEALIAGCKVICSDKAGARELINKRNGYLINPFEQKQLTETLSTVIKEIDETRCPITLKADLMPFNLDEKLKTLFSQL